MSTITAIRTLRRGSKRRSIEIDGEPWRSAAADVIAAASIQEGDRAEPDILAATLSKLEPRLARERAIRLLSYRDRSSKGLVDRLTEDGYPAEVSRHVVADLERIGFVDDVRYAAALVRSAVEVKRYGRERAALELVRAGIPEEIASEALAAALTPEDERASADRLAEAAARRTGTTVDKVAAKLVRKGYRPAIALAAARQAMTQAEARPQLDDDGWPVD